MTHSLRSPRVRTPCPSDDVVTVEENAVQRRLDVTVPQFAPAEASTQRSNHDLPHHRSTWQIEPQHQISTIGEAIPHSMVLPLGDPRRARNELLHVGLESRPRRPIRPVIEAVDLDVFDSQKRSETSGQRRFAGTGRPGNDDPRGATVYRIVRSENHGDDCSGHHLSRSRRYRSSRFAVFALRAIRYACGVGSYPTAARCTRTSTAKFASTRSATIASGSSR